MKIIENCIPREKQDQIENTLLDNSFPWYYHSRTVDDYAKNNLDSNSTDTFQFTHLFIGNGEINSEFKYLIDPLIDFINVPLKNIIRAKSNMITIHQNYPENHYQIPHIDDMDHGRNTNSFLYYVNDSDGDTYFFDNEKVLTNRIVPQKGKSILFDSKVLHAGSPPKIHNNRMVINFIFLI